VVALLDRVSLSDRRRESEPAKKAGNLLAVSDIYDSGLIITQEGALVWIANVIPPNWTLLSDLERQQLAMAQAELGRLLRANETVQFVVRATPVDPRRALEATRMEVGAIAGERPSSDRPAHNELDRARWRLYGAMEQSVIGQAGAHAAMSTDCYMIVPYTPSAGGLRGRLEQARSDRLPAGPLTPRLSEHRRAARESRDRALDLCEILDKAGVRTRLLDGKEVADLLWRRFNPTTAAERPSYPSVSEIVGELRPREELEDAKETARLLRERIARSDLDFSRSPWFCEIDRDFEQSVYVKGEIRDTQLGWLYEAMQRIQLPWTLCVYVHGLDRRWEHQKVKAKHNRLHALEAEAARKGQPVNVDRQLQRAETQELLAKMASEQRTAIHRMSVYATVHAPGPAPDPAELRRVVQRAGEEISARADAEVWRSPHIQRELFETTLPLGRDVADRSKRYVSEVIGDTIPLPGTRVGSAAGVPWMFSAPGRALENAHPFDERHENLIALVTGAAGAGKTMLANSFIGRTLAAGMTWYVIDRAGHYELLCRLIGGQHIDLGADSCPYAVNPWDVDDVRAVPRNKVSYLLALHRLLIGDEGHLDRGEVSQLEAAIRHAYDLAAQYGEQPRESHLLKALEARATQESEAGSVETAALIRSLAQRLGPYCRAGVCGEPTAGEGTYAYLLDQETTVPKDSPMVVFDTRQVSEDIMPAVAFSLVETVRLLAERHHQQLADSPELHARLLAGRVGLAMDEMWSLLLHADTASHVMDLGRRHRHWALFTLVATQQLRDFTSEHGRTFLDNSSMKFLGKQRNDREVELACELFRLSSGERLALATLQMQMQQQRRKESRWLWLNGDIGRGLVSLRLSPLEYWMYTSDRRRDVPLRQRKIAEHGGNLWAALIDLAESAGGDRS
jgi:hypothetical protein